jgi:hypothetical protein
MNKNDPLKTAVSKDSISDDEEDEALEEYTDEQFQTKRVVPPLSELVVGDEIRGNVDWMIDFAIIGNPKCGTTFLMVRSLLMEFGAKKIYFSSYLTIRSVCPLLLIISFFSIGSLAVTIRMCTTARSVLSAEIDRMSWQPCTTTRLATMVERLSLSTVIESREG